LQPTHISVTFKIVTPDQLRKIIFTLTRMSDSASDSWTVMFELGERADPANDFQMVIQLQVDVDHKDEAKAAATATHGLDADQHTKALLAADIAKEVKTGDAKIAEAREQVIAIVAARNASSPR